MTLQVEIWQLITLMISFLGLVFGAGKILLSQTDKRLDQRFRDLEEIRKASSGAWDNKISALMGEVKGWRDLERELLKFKAALPIEYVRREDYVRNQTVIEAKLDALALKIENLQLKGRSEC